MKFRLIALVLALSVTLWAQTATQSAPPQSSPATPKAQCAGCDKAAAENGAGCCHHAKGEENKEAASCCGGKEGSSCCGKGMQCGKESAKNGSCCGDKANCGEGKSCCGKSAEGEKTAMNCCQGKQCKRHHMSEPPSPGN